MYWPTLWAGMTIEMALMLNLYLKPNSAIVSVRIEGASDKACKILCGTVVRIFFARYAWGVCAFDDHQELMLV
jgi:hypothetical protein